MRVFLLPSQSHCYETLCTYRRVVSVPCWTTVTRKINDSIRRKVAFVWVFVLFEYNFHDGPARAVVKSPFGAEVFTVYCNFGINTEYRRLWGGGCEMTRYCFPVWPFGCDPTESGWSIMTMALFQLVEVVSDSGFV
jgi:hypothetical protein